MVVEKTLLNAVTATTTSDPVNVSGFKRIGLQLLAASITSGNGAFIVQGTIDGTNWVTLNTLLDNVTNTNAQNLTRVASKTLSSNTSALMWLDNFIALKAIRVKVTVTTDGAYSAFVVAGE